jgi:hypothetical protein
MYSSKNIIIHNTTSAAIFQLSSIIFDHFVIYIKSNKLQESMDNEKIGLNHYFYQYNSLPKENNPIESV